MPWIQRKEKEMNKAAVRRNPKKSALTIGYGGMEMVCCMVIRRFVFYSSFLMFVTATRLVCDYNAFDIAVVNG